MNGPAAPPALAATGLRFTAGEAVLVDDVDLVVAPGEIVAIIGPNGAGKSTLLALLAGDLTPERGTVMVGGDDLHSLDTLELARRRAVVPQHIAADVPFASRRVVEMGRHPLQVTGASDPETDRSVVDHLLAAVDMERRARLPFSSLSGGEQQRIVIARALAQETPLLLLDEPASSLDIAHQELTMRLMRDRAGAGGSVVVVLHDLNLAAGHADRIMLLHNGSVRAEGTAWEVLTPQLLSAVYAQPLRIERHPTRPCPLVVVG